ncbi:MAG: hypothetical protein ACI4SS_01585 [Clostridia bacterium]
MRTKPKIVVFAGPNGSGKSTVTEKSSVCGEYINADQIKAELNISDLEAAVEAEKRRETAMAEGRDFTFETVLSTERNLNLLRRAKEAGYFIRGFYILTCSSDINVMRVKARVEIGGHDVPVNKIRERYDRALKLLPQFVEVCDVCSVYDNSLDAPNPPFRIYKKYHGDIIRSNLVWTAENIFRLIYGEVPAN